MKQKIIIDNRTEQSLSNILQIASQFLMNEKQKTCSKNIGNKSIYCLLINNDCSKRLLFTYQKFLQEELF